MDLLGAPHGDPWVNNVAQVGTCFIDHNSFYGGYIIHCIANASGGAGTPFGSNRRECSEFLALLDGIIGAARYKQDQVR